MKEMPPKDPGAKLDYIVRWVDWLGTDTIATSTWTVPDGLVLATPAPSVVAGVATIWLQGGLPGGRYVCTNRVVTAAGREDERSFIVPVRNQ